MGLEHPDLICCSMPQNDYPSSLCLFVRDGKCFQDETNVFNGQKTQIHSLVTVHYTDCMKGSRQQFNCVAPGYALGAEVTKEDQEAKWSWQC